MIDEHWQKVWAEGMRKVQKVEERQIKKMRLDECVGWQQQRTVVTLSLRLSLDYLKWALNDSKWLLPCSASAMSLIHVHWIYILQAKKRIHRPFVSEATLTVHGAFSLPFFQLSTLHKLIIATPKSSQMNQNQGMQFNWQAAITVNTG